MSRTENEMNVIEILAKFGLYKTACNMRSQHLYLWVRIVCAKATAETGIVLCESERCAKLKFVLEPPVECVAPVYSLHVRGFSKMSFKTCFFVSINILACSYICNCSY